MNVRKSQLRDFGTILGAAAVILILVACGPDAGASDDTAPTVMTVGAENIYVVRNDTLSTGPAVSGTLAPEREAAVRAELSGSVIQTYVEAGQRVQRGALLARIDDAGISDAVTAARSAVVNAEGAAEAAAREEQRSRTLLAAGAIAERDAEASQRASVSAQAQLALARSQLATAQQSMQNTQVRAPFNGVVSARQVNGGDVVTPGTALFTIVEPSSMRFEASVPAAALGDVQLGDAVMFTVSGYPGRGFTGRVTRINPTADPATRQVPVLISVPNAGNSLVGGLFAEGRVAGDREVTLVAPLSAVDERGVMPVVYRIRRGTVERVPVQVGLRDEATEQLQLLAGVSAGDTLLTGAAQGITPGSPVRVNDPNDTPPVRPIATK